MKKCTTCKLEKSEVDFSKNKLRKDGLQTLCKECSSKRSQRYYKDRTEEHRETTKLRRKQKRTILRQKIEKIKQAYGCRKCGEDDVVCIDFHHFDSSHKDFSIADAFDYEWSWDKIVSEINKCVCLCSSCHRKIHAGRFQVTKEMCCNV